MLGRQAIVDEEQRVWQITLKAMCQIVQSIPLLRGMFKHGIFCDAFIARRVMQ